MFLVNYRPTAPDERKDEGFLFQAGMSLYPDRPLVPRPDLCGFDSTDSDERVADLQFRDVYECAVGHGVATTAKLGGQGECSEVTTEWMPSAEVEKVEAAEIRDVELSMEALAAAPSAAEMRTKLAGLISSYNDWIAGQRAKLDLPANRKEVALSLLHEPPLQTNGLKTAFGTRRPNHFRGVPDCESHHGGCRTSTNCSN